MMQRRKTFFLLLAFLLISQTALWAVTATVTNNGNIPVRVQYKTPDGQYQDLGHVQPGETMNVPGGVEKVRIVREPGQWAAPLKPGEVLDVEVKEDGKTSGKMDWYGGKVFFNPVTEGPLPVTVGNTPAPVTPQVPKEEPKVETTPQAETQPVTPAQEKTESGEQESKPVESWPWYGGVSDSIFFLQLFALLPFLFFLWFRSWRQPKYYIEGGYVNGGGELSWGWGWRYSGCGRWALLVSLIFGISLGALALWGHANFASNHGLIQRFGEDLYSFPYFLLSSLGLGKSGLSELPFILLFWSLGCLAFGGFCTILPMRWIYATPFFLALLPLFLLMRGCAGCFGPERFILDGGYEGIDYYPSALASLFLIVIFFGFILDRFDPYYYDEEDDDDDEEDERRHIGEAIWDFLDGNPWPLLVFLSGGCLCCFYGAAWYYGWDYAIDSYFYDAPMSLGLDFIPPLLMITLFWTMLWGGLGWAYYSDMSRFWLYLCLIPAFLCFSFLMTGNYPQRYLDHYYDEDGYPMHGSKPLLVIPAINRSETQQATVKKIIQDRFGDQTGMHGLNNNRGVSRALMFQDGDRDRERRLKDNY